MNIPAHRPSAPARALLGSEAVHLGPAWTREAEASAAPSLGPDALVVPTRSGRVSSVNPGDGTARWSVPVPDLKGQPAVGPDGTVYAVSGDHALLALDGDDGSVRWRLEGKGFLNFPPVVAPDGTLVLLVKEGGDRVRWLDPATGEKVGEREIRMGMVHRQPQVMADGTALVFDSKDYTLYALSPRSGGRNWRYPVGDLLSGDPRISEGTVYLPRAFGDVVAVDAATGKHRWHERIGKSPAVAAAPGAVFVTAGEGRLAALDPAAGTRLWEREVSDAPLAGPGVSQGQVVVGGSDGVARGFDGATGDPRWTASLGGSLGRPVAGPEDEVFFSDSSGRLVGLHPTREAARAQVEEPGGSIEVAPSYVSIGGVDLPIRAS